MLIVNERLASDKSLETYDDAFEEVIADSCESLLRDAALSEKAEQIYKKSPETANAFVRFFKKIIEKIKYYYSGIHPQSQEGRIVSEWKDSLNERLQLFIDGVNAAARNLSNKENSTNDGGVKEQVRKDFSEQIDDWLSGNGKANGKYNGQFFDIGTTPDVLVKHGAKKSKVIMYEDCLIKVTGGKHAIAIDEIKKLPYELEDPVLLFKGSVDNSFVALTELEDKQGNDVIVAIHINRKHNRNVIQKIASLYSKSDPYGNNKIKEYVNNQINQGNLLDASIKKAPNWFTSRGLQLPKLVQTIIDANNSILQSSPNSNTQNEKNQPRTVADLFGDMAWLDQDDDVSLLTHHFENNNEAIGEVLKKTASIPINDRTLKSKIKSVLNKYGVSESVVGNVYDEVKNILDLSAQGVEFETDETLNNITGITSRAVNDSEYISEEYPRGTSSSRILNDIDEYFKNGTKPEVSEYERFRYQSRTDADYLSAVERGDMEKAQKMEDKAAKV